MGVGSYDRAVSRLHSRQRKLVNFALSQTCAILFLIALSFVKMKYLDLLLVLSLSVVSVQNKTKQKKNAKGDRIRCYDSRCPIPGA